MTDPAQPNRPADLDYASVGVPSPKSDSTPRVSLAFALLFLGVILLSAGFCARGRAIREFLAFVWPLCAAAAALYLVLYFWSRRRLEQRRPLCWSGRIGCLGMLVLAVAGIGTMAIGLNDVMNRPNRVRCASNLKQIGMGIQLYANDHAGQFPPSFWELITSADLNPEVFICPSSPDERASGPTTQALLAEFRKPAHCSYIYVGSALTTQSPASAVAAYEKPENHDGDGGNVLYADGSVQWLDHPELNRIIKELAAGHNPPWPPTSQPTTRR